MTDPSLGEAARRATAGDAGRPGGAAAGLYVHVPFCLTRCHYCDFAAERVAVVPDGYVATVLREAEAYAALYDSFDTVYLGGGTPSRLPSGAVATLLRGLRSRLPVAAAPEVTLEANPDDVTPTLLDGLAEAGVTRISLGVQSLVDAELGWLGRRHDAAIARAAAKGVRERGLALAVDLIYGLPGQTPEGWAAVLEEAVALGPEHLSCYQLTVEPGTPLGRRARAGEPVVAREEAQRALFLQTAKQLGKAGFERYEVSNFALGPERRSRHNQKYWHHVPYLGLGPAAHSFRGRRRWWNHRQWGRYREAVETTGRGVAEEEILDAASLRLERLMLGLRLAEGLPLSFLCALAGGLHAVATLCDEGLLRVEGAHARPTSRGLLVADRLPLRFADRPARGT